MTQQSHSWPQRQTNSNLKRPMHPCAHSSTLHNRQDMQNTQMSINKWMDKEDVVPMRNGMCSHVGKNEIMPFKATWADPEMVVLSEAGQQEKAKYHMIITYTWNSK